MNLKSIEDTLPNELSDLLDVAVQDLVKVERSPRYIVDMCSWYLKETDGPCQVCLAGAVLAKSVLKEPPVVDIDSIEPRQMRASIRRKMVALDGLRVGNIVRAYGNLKGKMMANLSPGLLARLDKLERSIVGYAANPTLFKKQLRTLRNDLRAEGF